MEAFLRELCQFGYVAAPRAAGGGDHERRRLAARMGLCAAFALNTMGFLLPVYLGMPAARARAVRAVFGFAMIYNVTTVAFSMAGHMSPLLADILMPFSSIFSIVIVAALSRGKITEQ